MMVALIMALMTAVSAQAAEMVVYKDPYCGCCEEWAKALQAAGMPLRMEVVDDMDAVKAKWHVPEDAWSCHTAVADGYVFEGHVPLEAVKRVLTEKPEIVGVAVPGMPAGSLGMGDDPQAAYDVVAIGRDGGQSVYMEVRP
jgi:hypothetical protein